MLMSLVEVNCIMVVLWYLTHILTDRLLEGRRGDNRNRDIRFNHLMSGAQNWLAIQHAQECKHSRKHIFTI